MARPRNNGESQADFDARVLDELNRWQRDNPISPSVRELAALCGVKSTALIQNALKRLEEAGNIVQWNERRARQWRVVPESEKGMEMPETSEVKLVRCQTCKTWNSNQLHMCPTCGGQGWYLQGAPEYKDAENLTLSFVFDDQQTEIDTFKQRIEALELIMSNEIRNDEKVIEALGILTNQALVQQHQIAELEARIAALEQGE